jgi:outer membrane protein assembly factor BamB
LVLGRAGTIYALDDTSGQPAPDFSIAPAGSAVSSPALSADGCLVFGDDEGMIHIRKLVEMTITPTPTATTECRDQSVLVAEEGGATFAIRSSPAIGADGVIYLGADNGRVYAIGGPS